MKYIILLSVIALSSCARDERVIVPQGNNTVIQQIITEAGRLNGVVCAVHDLPNWDGSTSLPQAFVGNPIVGTFVMDNFSVGDTQASSGFPGMPADIRAIVGDEGYALDCSSFLVTDTSGDYTFKLFSDDGSELRINNQLVINNQGLHAPAEVTSAPTRLNRGLNRINVVYYQGPMTQIALQLKQSGPNLPEEVIPASKFAF